jgi:hypothetical protein
MQPAGGGCGTYAINVTKGIDESVGALCDFYVWPMEKFFGGLSARQRDAKSISAGFVQNPEEYRASLCLKQILPAAYRLDRK